MAATALVAACGRRTVPAPVSHDVAWWWWRSTALPKPGPRVALVYVHLGTLEDAGASTWPAHVPPADRYVLVWRSDRPAVPRDATIRPLIAAYARLRDVAATTGATVAGLQVDADVPTASLRTFAAWLDTLRRALPPGATLSVTGLLDWFREGTDVSRVADAVDELVPQFYDLEPRSSAPGIAHPIDLSAWTSRLDALQRPYRLGVATFGRIERAEEHDGVIARAALRDVTPLELADRFQREPATHVTAARERVVDYTNPAEQAGRKYQLVIPPADVVASNAGLAEACGRWCAGIAFFRWPSVDESVVLGPSDTPPTPPAGPSLVVEPGSCAPLWCADVWLVEPDPFPATDRIIRIRASSPLRMVQTRDPRGPTEVTHDGVGVRVPAFHGMARLRLARLFTDAPARITLDPTPLPLANPAPPARR